MKLSELEKILDDRYGVTGTIVDRVGEYEINMYRQKTTAYIALLEREEKCELLIWIKNKCVYSKSAKELFTMDPDNLKRKLDMYFPHRSAKQEQMELWKD